MDISRLKKLAGLLEAIQVEDPDEEDRRYDELSSREETVKKAIIVAFKRIGLSIAETEDFSGLDIIYMEDQGREACVVLDDNEIDLDVLAKLKLTGLSNKFKIISGKEFELRIEFVVSKEIDNAVL